MKWFGLICQFRVLLVLPGANNNIVCSFSYRMIVACILDGVFASRSVIMILLLLGLTSNTEVLL